jgi:hypothetical protein
MAVLAAWAESAASLVETDLMLSTIFGFSFFFAVAFWFVQIQDIVLRSYFISGYYLQEPNKSQAHRAAPYTGI